MDGADGDRPLPRGLVKAGTRFVLRPLAVSERALGQVTKLDSLVKQ